MFDGKKFSLENCLALFSSSFVLMPASAIYEEQAVLKFATIIPRCHIYMIGLLPKIEFAETQTDGDQMVAHYEVNKIRHKLRWKSLPGLTLCSNGDRSYFVDNDGNQILPDRGAAIYHLNRECNADIGFEVLYIGQSYGKDGSRNALDRLLKHETLQKISLQGVPDGYELFVLLVSIAPSTELVMFFNPGAEHKGLDFTNQRADIGIEKIKNITEAERTALYEASLIRYFQPRFNKEFKNSFPSTNMKLLADCYDKDFAGLVAEIKFDYFPIKIFSESVAPAFSHLVTTELHDEWERKLFFLEPGYLQSQME